jgi:hypothetical protein
MKRPITIKITRLGVELSGTTSACLGSIPSSANIQTQNETKVAMQN